MGIYSNIYIKKRISTKSLFLLDLNNLFNEIKNPQNLLDILLREFCLKKYLQMGIID